MDDGFEVAPGVIANEIVGSVGDGCVVRLLTDDDFLAAVAVEHRDVQVRDALGEQLHGQRMPRAQAGWAAETLAKGVPFALSGLAATQALVGGPVSPEHDLSRVAAHALLAPLRADGRTIGVVQAFRGPGGSAYTVREQLIIAELAAGVRSSPKPADAAYGLDGHALLEQAGVAVWVSDLRGLTTYANAAASKLIGTPSAALVGSSMRRYLGPLWRDSPVSLSAWAPEAEEELLRSDGERRLVSITSAPLTDARGQHCGTVHSATDVTERKRSEASLRMALGAHQAANDLIEEARKGASGVALLRRATSMVADQLGAEFVTVSAVHGADQLVLQTAVGWDRGLIGRTVPFSTRSATGLCLDDDLPYSVADYEAVEGVEMGELARQAEARSAICIGIGAGVGVMGIVSPRPDAFSDHDLSFLRTVSWLLASRWTAPERRLKAV